MSAEDAFNLNEWVEADGVPYQSLPTNHLFSSQTYTNVTSAFFAPDEGTYPAHSHGANAMFSSSDQDVRHSEEDAILSPARLYDAFGQHANTIPSGGLARAYCDAPTLSTPLEFTSRMHMPQTDSSSSDGYVSPHSSHPVLDDASGCRVYTTPSEALAHAWSHFRTPAPRTPSEPTFGMRMRHADRFPINDYEIFRGSSNPVRDDVFSWLADPAPSDALTRAWTGNSGAQNLMTTAEFKFRMPMSRTGSSLTDGPYTASSFESNYPVHNPSHRSQTASGSTRKSRSHLRQRQQDVAKPRGPLPKKEIFENIIDEPRPSTWIERNANDAVAYYDPHHKDAEDLPKQAVKLALCMPVKISKADDSDDQICRYINPRSKNGEVPNYVVCRYIDPISKKQCRSCFVIPKGQKPSDSAIRNAQRHLKTIHAPHEREEIKKGNLTFERAVALKDPDITLEEEASVCSDQQCVHFMKTGKKWKVYARRADRLIQKHREQHRKWCCSECSPKLSPETPTEEKVGDKRKRSEE